MLSQNAGSAYTLFKWGLLTQMSNPQYVLGKPLKSAHITLDRMKCLILFHVNCCAIKTSLINQAYNTNIRR